MAHTSDKEELRIGLEQMVEEEGILPETWVAVNVRTTQTISSNKPLGRAE
jgi:hypothetical protein